MKINFYGVMSKYKVDALVKWSGATVVENRDGSYHVNGYHYKTYPEVGHHILESANFFIHSGVGCDVEFLNATKDSRGFKMFYIEE